MIGTIELVERILIWGECSSCSRDCEPLQADPSNVNPIRNHIFKQFEELIRDKGGHTRRLLTTE